MSTERQHQVQFDKLQSNSYAVDIGRVIELERLLVGISYSAKTHFEKERSAGFVRLIEDTPIDTDNFQPGVYMPETERHRRIDDTIRRFRQGGHDKYLGVIKRQLPSNVQRLTVSVLNYAAGETQISQRIRHQLTWDRESDVAIGQKLVAGSIEDSTDVMIAAADLGDTPVQDIGTSQNLPFMMPEMVTATTFDDLEQEMYTMAARLKSAA